MERPVALATCRELPHLDGDEEPLLRALARLGVSVELIDWRAPLERFTACACTVIRSTWDYTKDRDAFVAWARAVDEESRLFNPSQVVAWNTHKRYLDELGAEGVPTVPTVFVPRGKAVTLAEICARRGLRDVVVKPTVGAGSRDTLLVRHADHAATEAQFAALLSTQDMMVQPYLRRIAEGETSLIFIDGAFTHAVNKVPRSGDFRSQPEFGSDVSRVEPTHDQLGVALDALAVTGGRLLYARVDLVTADEGTPLVIELELVEPSLYLRHSEEAATALANAIAARRSSHVR